MTVLTLDVSAALRNLDADRIGRHAGIAAAMSQAQAIYAPDLYVVESANALWKYVKAGQLDENRAAQLHAQALVSVDQFVPDRELFPEALAIACREKHPVYDLLYLLTARRTASALLTVDKRLATLAKKMGIALAI